MIKYPSLHMNTHYSLLESTINIDSIILHAKENGLEELVITDHNNMYGVGEFVRKCKMNGLKPIIGVDLDVDDYRLILIAKNYEGYQFLSGLVSKKARKEKITLSQINPSNIVIIDHPVMGHFAKTNRPLSIHNYFAKNFEGSSLKVSFANMIGDQEEASQLLGKVKGVDKPLSSSYEFIVDDGSIEAEQSITIIKECYFEFPRNISPLPRLDHGDKTSDQVLKELIIQSAKRMLMNVVNKEIYKARLNTEMKVIESQGFSDYFIILHDLVKWSRSQNIVIGPGRGSAAGSLISFLLNITEIDPIKFGLLFERFLNPERISLPDIDIDIQDNRRNEVIQYLFDKYGAEKVAMISTFQRIGAKMAIRDAGRAMNMPLRDVDSIAKSIPANHSLKEAYAESSIFAANIEKSDQTKLLYKNAQYLEGIPRQQGTHAAGIIISDKIIKNFVPTTVSSDGLNQVQFTMDYLEENGLLKIDLLGLRNLTILESIKESVEKVHDIKIDFSKIPLNDESTFKLLSRGDTNGIFQFESVGMRKTLRLVKVDTFDDIPAILALFRPGPMDNIPVYADRKNNPTYEQLHHDYDKFVKPTNGIIIYQEQIMQIAQKFSGMSFGQADILRRAIGKKKMELIASQKSVFLDGAKQLGHSEAIATRIYDQIEKFANYGFNKSHAVAYSMLSYRLAYMKSKYPFEFYSSLMRASTGSSETLLKYISEAKKKRINIVSPSINQSTDTIEIIDGSIVLPFSIIKGIGKVAVEELVAVRGKEKFGDFFEAIHRMIKGNISETIITLLIESGAMREFGNNETLLMTMISAIRFSKMVGNDDYATRRDMRPNIVPRKANTVLDMAREKQLFGFNLNYFASLPFECEKKITDIKVNEITEVVFTIERVRESSDKNGNPYGRYIVTDSSDTISLFVFSDLYKFTKLAKTGQLKKAKIKCRKHNDKKTYNLVEQWKDIHE